MPAAALVKSVGSARSSRCLPGSSGRWSRRSTSPIFGGFNRPSSRTSGSDSGNKFTLNGDGATTAMSTERQLHVVEQYAAQGRVYSQGTATIGQVVNADVWAKNAVNLSNGIRSSGTRLRDVLHHPLQQLDVFGNARPERR
jgi:hypothetical protein